MLIAILFVLLAIIGARYIANECLIDNEKLLADERELSGRLSKIFPRLEPEEEI